MDSADDEGLFGSVLIYMGILLFSMAVLAAPIYLITGPIVFDNDARSDLARVVKQPVIAADDNRQPNAKAEAALKALVARPDGAQLRAEMPVHRRVVPPPPSTHEVTTNQVTSAPAAAFVPSFAPL